MMRTKLTVEQVRQWFAKADEDEISDFLDAGLQELVEDLEQDDFFGTEGFGKRFA